jgi:RNase_H superfamily
MDSKILYLDIEWKPATMYVFDPFNVHASPEHVIDDGGLLCFCYHWEGEKEYHFQSEWEHGNDVMANTLYYILGQADAVVTYNGDKYDLPKIRGHLILHGLTPPPPPTSIDLIKAVQKLGFMMNRLAYVGPLLGVGSKKKHEGFGLWRSVMEGNEAAQYRMQRYCTQDVRLLVHLYKKVLPFIDNHPHLGDNKGACGGCGSNHVQLRGFRRTKYFKVQRLQCQDCGAWSTGTRRKVK